MGLKTLLSDGLRRVGLLGAVDYSRFLAQRLFYFRKNETFRRAQPAEAFPPAYALYETFRLDYARYLESGREAAEWVRGEVSDALTTETPVILDWGCGPGRVTRHLPSVFPGSEVHGVDYNEDYVAWCAANLPGVFFERCALTPPLPFGDGVFDLIVGISIFTHLSAEAHERWIAELARVLRPGGVSLVTTMGAVYREQLGAQARARFDAGSLVVKARGGQDGHRTCSAYQPANWFFCSIEAGGLKVLTHTPGRRREWGLEQDTWVLTKGASG